MLSSLKEHVLPASILVEGPLNPASVSLRMTGQGIEYPPEAREYIEEQWKERLRTGRSTADSDAVALVRIESSSGGVIIVGAPSKFSERNGTGQPEFRKRFGDDLVAKTIGVNALIRTEDGYILVGQRNTYRKGKIGGLHIAGGGLDRNEGLLDALNREVKEETGISGDECKIQRLLGITQSKETLGIDVGFLGETVLTRKEIEARPTDGELGGVFFPDTPLESRQILLKFLGTASTPVIAALYLNGKQNFGEEWAGSILEEMDRIFSFDRQLGPELLEARMHTLARMLKNY